MTDQTLERWQGHPRLAKAVRGVALLAPIVVAMAVAWLVGRRLPPANSFRQLLLWWLVLSAISTTVLLLMNRLVRRLLPLAVLLRLSLIFPDRAPSRYKIARSVATTRQLEAEVARARDEGQIDDRQQAAETVLKLVAALNVHDKATRGHAERVRIFSDMIAEEMGLGEADVARLRWASLLHDVGKITVHPDILNKPGKPTEEEWEQLRNHPLEGAKITAPLNDWLGEWSLAIEQHHEMYDGSGYPYGLAGKQISLGARIVSVADVFDVMTSARSYKSAMTAAVAREELARCAGTQFDPDVVRAFLAIAIGRLRLAAAGPLSWITNAAVVRDLVPQLGSMAGAASGIAAAAAGIAAYGFVPTVDTVPIADEPTPTPVISVTMAPSDEPLIAAAAVPDPIVVEPTPAASGTAPAPVVLVPAEPDPVEAPTADPTPIAAPITPTPTNAPPRARRDRVEAREDDGAIVFDVRENDEDPDDDELTVVGVLLDGGGTAIVTPEGLVRFTPAPDWSGQVSGTYTLSDGVRLVQGAFDIDVLPVNDPPAYRAGTTLVDVAEDSGRTTLPGWATEVTPGPAEDGQPLAFEVTASNPSLFAEAPSIDTRSGDLTFRVLDDANGASTLDVVLADDAGTMLGGDLRTPSKIVTLVVNPRNDRPVAVDDTATTDAGQAVTVDVVANDQDVDGDVLGLARVESATSGVATLRPDGRLRFTPAVGFAGEARIAYVVTDPGGLEDVGELVVDVRPLVQVNRAPTAVTDVIVVVQDGLGQTVDLLANDSDPDGDTLTLLGMGGTSPARGVATFLPGGRVRYVPNPGVSGADTFTYRVTDGSLVSTGRVNVTISGLANRAPVALDDGFGLVEDAGATVLDVVSNDMDPDGDALAVTGLGATSPVLGAVSFAPDGTPTYTPDPNATGTDTFSYVVTDGVLTDEGLVTITIAPVNDPPIARDDTLGILEDAAATTVDVLDNDSDVDSGTLTVTGLGATTPALGNVTFAPDGTPSYTPDPNANGTDTFSYVITDGALTDEALVTVTIQPVNDPPVPDDDAYAATNGTTLTRGAGDGVLDGDVDVDGDVLTAVVGTPPAPSEGTLALAPDGSFTFDARPSVTGPVTFTYLVDDGVAPPVEATVTITVFDPPVSTATVHLTAGVVDATTNVASDDPPANTGGSVPDWDGDEEPGWTVADSGQEEDEDDPEKFRDWLYPVASELRLRGVVTLDLWLATPDFERADIDHSAWLYDCDASGAGCVRIASTVDVHHDDWSVDGAWIQRRAVVGGVDHVIAAGRTLRLRLMFDHEDVMLPLTGEYPSVLNLPVL